MMQVNVKLFAALRDKAGCDQMTLELPDGATVAAAREAIAGQAPAIGPMLGRIAFALNRRYAQADAELRDGDELALIPPVSGG